MNTDQCIKSVPPHLLPSSFAALNQGRQLEHPLLHLLPGRQVLAHPSHLVGHPVPQGSRTYGTH